MKITNVFMYFTSSRSTATERHPLLDTSRSNGGLGSDLKQRRHGRRFPIFSTYRQAAQQLCIIMFFLLSWGILYAETGAPVSLNGEILSMSLLVIASYLVGWIWLKITTLPALIGMLLTGILFQNTGIVHMTDQYRKLNQDLRKVALVIILTRAGLGLDAKVLKKHYAAVLQLGLLPWIVECIAIAVTADYLLGLPWIWGFLLGSMIASVSPAVVVPCLFRLRDVGYGVSKGIPTLVLAATAIDDSVSVAVFSIILNAMFSSGSVTWNIIKGPLSILAGVLLGSLWGTMTSIIPEKGDIYVVPLRFLILFLGGLFALFMSNLIGWSGAGPLAILCSGFAAAYYWDKQGWPINKNPVSNIFRILWIFFEPILFAFTGAQITAALGPAALDLINGGQTTGAPVADETARAKTLLTVSVLSVVLSAPLGAIFIAITGPWLLTKDGVEESAKTSDEENGEKTELPSIHL